jgi:hypothetical protein
MKLNRIILSLALLPALMLPGCKTATSTTPPAALAPGFSSQADQTMDQVLVGAHAFYATIQADVASGKYTPSVTEKTALDSFALALNTAQTVYISFHQGAATQAQAQAAVNAVSTQQTALQSIITAGVK